MALLSPSALYLATPENSPLLDSWLAELIVKELKL